MIMPSLRDFADAQQPIGGCKACGLPPDLRRQVADNQHLPRTVISKWLKQEGHLISESSVKRHLANHLGAK